MNSWDSKKLRDDIKAVGRKKLVMCGLWTEVCINTACNSAMLDGFEPYIVADVCGATSKMAQEYSMQRMIQAGAHPVTWQQVMLEWQRDWAKRDTYDAVMDIVRTHRNEFRPKAAALSPARLVGVAGRAHAPSSTGRVPCVDLWRRRRLMRSNQR